MNLKSAKPSLQVSDPQSLKQPDRQSSSLNDEQLDP